MSAAGLHLVTFLQEWNRLIEERNQEFEQRHVRVEPLTEDLAGPPATTEPVRTDVDERPGPAELHLALARIEDAIHATRQPYRDAARGGVLDVHAHDDGTTHFHAHSHADEVSHGHSHGLSRAKTHPVTGGHGLKPPFSREVTGAVTGIFSRTRCGMHIPGA